MYQYQPVEASSFWPKTAAGLWCWCRRRRSQTFRGASRSKCGLTMVEERAPASDERPRIKRRSSEQRRRGASDGQDPQEVDNPTRVRRPRRATSRTRARGCAGVRRVTDSVHQPPAPARHPRALRRRMAPPSSTPVRCERVARRGQARGSTHRPTMSSAPNAPRRERLLRSRGHSALSPPARRWRGRAHSPLNPPRRRSDAMTRCQGTRVSARGFLRITAPDGPRAAARNFGNGSIRRDLARGHAAHDGVRLGLEGCRHPLDADASTTQCRCTFETAPDAVRRRDATARTQPVPWV